MFLCKTSNLININNCTRYNSCLKIISRLSLHKTHRLKNSIQEQQTKLFYSCTSTSYCKHAEQSQLSHEQEYLIKLKDDPDTFGAASNKEAELDEGDIEEQKYFEEQPNSAQKLRTKQYADIIKDLIRKRKIKEAIDIVEVRMIKEDRVKPGNYIYNLLLGACGRVGYTKKAFSLYNDMKKRGLAVTGGTYTALFNACANSPWPKDGLTRAEHLRNIMIEKMYEPNDTNYNAMIKAFGRCGDLSTAFSIVDEMTSKRFKLKDDTISFLLQACISDKEAGFRHALLVWRKLYKKRIRPTIYNYNLMLRCIRECGLGNVETTTDVINKILSDHPNQIESQRLLPNENTLQLCDSSNDTENNENECKPVIQNEIMENVPNLMARVPHLGNIISLSEITKPEDRLLLVGGLSGFLKNMEENKCVPNIKTFTLLLDLIPNTLAAENMLLKAMQINNIIKDVDFYNMLIKKRSMRFDFENAKDVVNMMKEDGKQPDLITYGVLALSCSTKEEALLLIEEMRGQNYRLNIEILGAMLYQACYRCNFSYIFELFNIMLQEEIKPSKKFFQTLQEFKKKCKYINENESHQMHSKEFQRGFKKFKVQLKNWLEKVELDELEDVHPWQQFRQTTETNVKHYKNKYDYFKPRHNSLFKQKTSLKNKENKENSKKNTSRYVRS